MGVPSIATRVYAIPEAIEDGETGLLVPAGRSSTARRKRYSTLKADKDLRAGLGPAV